MTIFADAENYVNEFGALAIAVVIVSEKIARCIPTTFNNKILEKIAKFFYTVFAVIGLKAPDIAAIQDGKIVTNIEAVAQAVIDKQPESAEVEPKSGSVNVADK